MAKKAIQVDSDNVAESLDILEPVADSGDLSDLKPRQDLFESVDEVEDMDDLEPEEATETIANADIPQEDLAMEKMEEELDEEAEAEEDDILLDEVERKIKSGQAEFEPTDFEAEDELDEDLEEVA